MSLSLSKAKLCEVLGSDHFCPALLGAKQALEPEGIPKLSFRGVEYDSREIRGGELFLALAGESNHGHEFLPQAFGRGAALALVEDQSLLDSFSEPERLILVDDTLKAFWKLASWWREELAIPVLGITGSVGKTTVKEMCASILLKHSLGNFSLKSYNNHVGLPYTICRTSRRHHWLVLEMGMNHSGEISAITKVGRPDVAVILNIAPAHIENFGTVQGIADAKFEIVEGIPQNGTLILLASDGELLSGLERHRNKAPKKVLYYAGDSADFKVPVSSHLADFKSLGFEGSTFQIGLFGDHLSLRSKVPGKHSAINACVAALACKTLLPDLTDEQIIEGISQFRPPEMRINVCKLANGSVLVNDCYNANPTSMKAALDLMFDNEETQGKVGLLLGDMLELGERSERYHQEVAEYAIQKHPAFLVAVGKFAKTYCKVAEDQGIPAFEAESPVAAAHIVEKLEWSALLVKGSRGAKLERGVEKLLEIKGGELIEVPEETLNAVSVNEDSNS